MQNYSQPSSQEVRQILDSSKEILILLSKNPSYDEVAASLSLFLSFSSLGKHVSIASPSPMTVEFSRLVGVDKVVQTIGNGGKNLIVSFPYVEGSIEKVSYNIESDIFNLVIEPREGFPIITPEKLSYAYGGGSFDCIFTIGVSNVEELDSLYFQNQNLFSEKPVINIDTHSSNTRFGRINIVEQNITSLSEMITTLLTAWNLRIDPDISTNLLAGIIQATNNFMSQGSGVSAFETAAILMRNGARRLDMNQPSGQATPPQQAPYQFPTSYSQPSAPGVSPSQQFPQTFQNPTPQSNFRPAQPQTRNAYQQHSQLGKQQMSQQPKVQTRNQQPLQQVQKPQKKDDSAPPDWLKPKIYKGSTLL